MPPLRPSDRVSSDMSTSHCPAPLAAAAIQSQNGSVEVRAPVAEQSPTATHSPVSGQRTLLTLAHPSLLCYTVTGKQSRPCNAACAHAQTCRTHAWFSVWSNLQESCSSNSAGLLNLNDCVRDDLDAIGHAYDWWRMCKNREDWRIIIQVLLDIPSPYGLQNVQQQQQQRQQQIIMIEPAHSNPRDSREKSRGLLRVNRKSTPGALPSDGFQVKGGHSEALLPVRGQVNQLPFCLLSNLHTHMHTLLLLLLKIDFASFNSPTACSEDILHAIDQHACMPACMSWLQCAGICIT